MLFRSQRELLRGTLSSILSDVVSGHLSSGLAQELAFEVPHTKSIVGYQTFLGLEGLLEWLLVSSRWLAYVSVSPAP